MQNRNTLQSAFDYAEDIRSGKIIACKWVKLAVARFWDDLENGHKRGLRFYEEQAKKDLQFFDFLNIKRNIEAIDRFGHTINKRSYDRFILQPWQTFILANQYGWMKGNYRRFTDINVCVARKQGKSTLASGIGVKGLIFDNEIESQVYCAANTLKQAKIVFDESKKMIKRSPILHDFFNLKDDLLAESITFQETESTMRPVTGDASTLDGFDPHLAILDEPHEAKDNSMYDIFATGNGGRPNPQIFMISTAGFHKDYWYYEQLMASLGILEGKYQDDNTFVMYYTLDSEEEINDPKMWIKANPSMGVSMTEGYLHKQVARMQNSPSFTVGVKTKNFNMFVDSQEQWIASELWADLARTDDILKEKEIVRVWGGIDGAKVRDMFAISLLFEFADGTHYIKHRFYIARKQIGMFQGPEGLLFDQWQKNGFLHVTNGDTIDIEEVELVIKEMYAQYSEKFGFWGYDPYKLTEMVARLNEEFPREQIYDETTGKWKMEDRLQPVRQNLMTLTEPTTNFENLVENKQLFHDNNPVMNWMMANVVMIFDSIQNYKPDRKSDKKKIDGVISTLNALKLKIKFYEAGDDEVDSGIYIPKKR